ncbi:hypothetical protein NV379_20410 [Paenibacillus sp. N1-5-1-14]|uniref:hypothetical protein n=1 Tax=Paenibacillus radicibacter TaxID=2972488 RepID=UPI002159001B|nr:hypothetical protein [Paenibacillus radicibacter]MCR8645021.1 hypothetical protein [Paenibacillus radicibacter]
MKFKWMLSFILLLTLVGCSIESRTIFSGEGEYWKAAFLFVVDDQGVVNESISEV